MAKVIAVAKKAEPGLPKHTADEINIIENWGVEGDYHAGTTVRHRYLARKDPTRPNLRQVNLLHSELFPFLAKELGVEVQPGQMGENITTEGLDLMTLPLGTRLKVGESVIIELKEARVPCHSLDYLDKKVLPTLAKKPGEKRPNAGFLGIVISGGTVRPGDEIEVIN
jgi:MOSC domain-containing protein YiiM